MKARATLLVSVCFGASIILGRAPAATASPAEGPCPELEAARAAATVSPSKESELAIDVAMADCRALDVSAPEPAGPAPVLQFEAEPNDTTATPNVLTFANGPVAIVSAAITPGGDVDFYSFMAVAGSRVWLSTDTGGTQNPGATSRDTVVDLLAADGTTVIENDDDDGTGNGGDGTNETGLASTIAGHTLSAGGTYYIRVHAFSPTGIVNPYRLFVARSQATAAPERESNDTAATAMLMTRPISLVRAAINAAGDSDYYSVTLAVGNILYFSADADPERDGTGTDLVVELRDPADVLLATIDSSITGSLANPAAETGSFTIGTAGTYYVRVRHFSAGGTGTYDLLTGVGSGDAEVPRAIRTSVDTAGNGVWEPGESVDLISYWGNTGGSSLILSGALNSLSGPGGATHTITDAFANYGTIDAGFMGSCVASGNCQGVSVSNPGVRPVQHWDASVYEQLSSGLSKIWTLHVGRSFTDVPTSNPFYPFVETIFHAGVTGGCGGTDYCPGNAARREQMAVFVLKAKEGTGYLPPPATGIFTDVPVDDPFARWIEELFHRGVVTGCGPTTFCPDDNVNRQQMAIFLLKTLEGSAYVPPACTGAFLDVPCSNPFAPWIEEIFDRGVAAGCGNGNYCPANSATRGQMAPFLTKAFNLQLYGP